MRFQKVYLFLNGSYDMVEIIFDPQDPYSVELKRNWKYFSDYIYVLGIFLVIFLLFGVIAIINDHPSKNALLIWVICLLLIEMWFFISTKSLIMNLDENLWKIQTNIGGLTFPLESGKITDISFIKLEEIVRDSFNNSSKLALNFQKYDICLKLIKFQPISAKNEENREQKVENENGLDEISEEKNFVFIRHRTSNFRTHISKMKNISIVAQELVSFFQGLDIPIELVLDRKVYRNDELISSNA